MAVYEPPRAVFWSINTRDAETHRGKVVTATDLGAEPLYFHDAGQITRRERSSQSPKIARSAPDPLYEPWAGNALVERPRWRQSSPSPERRGAGLRQGKSLYHPAVPLSDEDVSRLARHLHILLEPLAAGSYFAGETAAAYEAIGLPPASGYWCGRSAPLGRVPIEVVVATFAVWEPEIVASSVEQGWASGVTHEAVMDARVRGARDFVERANGAPPEPRIPDLLRRAVDAIFPAGYPLFAALRSTRWPNDPAAASWLGADLIREQRNDAHIAAWRAAGLDPVEVHLLSALWSGQPFHLRAAFMGWRRQHITAARERLEARGLVENDPPSFTACGRAVRAQIEAATDRQQRPVVEALGGDVDELLDQLDAMFQSMAPRVVDVGSRIGSVAVLRRQHRCAPPRSATAQPTVIG